MRKSAGLNATRYAVGYVRVSTAGQADEGVSLEAQAVAIRRWCESQDLELVTVCEDAGISGACELAKRPGLLEALEAVRSSKAAVLVAYKRDRLARDVVIAATIERMAQSAGGRVMTVEGTNGASPEDALMRCIVDAFGQYERAVIAARTRAALSYKKSRGELTGKAPWGEQVGEDGRTLETNAREAEVLRQVRELRDGGMTLRGIVAELETRQCVNRAGKPLVLTSVARMLKAA